MTTFKLNSREKRLELELDLKGEREPITIRIEAYELIEEHGVTYGVIQQISTSREWMTTAARQLVVGKRFPLPPEIAGILPMIL